MPVGVEEQKRNVAFQLLLLMDNRQMQDNRQKAVRPLDFIYCLQENSDPSKTLCWLWCQDCALQEGGAGRTEKESQGDAQVNKAPDTQE